MVHQMLRVRLVRGFVILLVALTCALWSGLLLAPAPAFASQPAASSASQPASGQAAPQPGKSITVLEAVEQLPKEMKVPNRHALIIGVDEYADARITRLNACVKDATELARVLTDPQAGMFPPANVRVLTNKQVTRAAVVRELGRLAREAGPDDLVVIFFSGHGDMDAEGSGYWVMHDTDPSELLATALSGEEFAKLQARIKTRRLVAIVDACHAAATAQVGKTKSAPNLEKILSTFNGDGRVTLVSSQEKELSMTITSGEGAGHSAFAWHVIEGLRGKAADDHGVVTLDGLWNYVKDRTEQTARQQGGNQTPRLGTPGLGSKFLLAINAERMLEVARRQAAASQDVRRRVGVLRALGIDGKISVEQVKEGQALLEALPGTLDNTGKSRQRVYLDLTEGRLAPEYLEVALSKFPRSAPQPVQPVQPQPTQPSQPAPTQPVAGRPQHLARKTVELAPGVSAELVYIGPGWFWMGSHQSPQEVVAAYPSSDAKQNEQYLEWSANEHPRHKVRLTKGFWLGKTEVTVGQFGAFVRETGYETTAERLGTSWVFRDTGWKEENGIHWKNPGMAQEDNHPVVHVSWEDVDAFCKWLTEKQRKAGRISGVQRYRLPTEAEWEFACRAGTTTAFSFGDTLKQGDGYLNGAGEGEGWRDSWPFNDGFVKRTSPVGSFRPNGWGLQDMHGNVWEWCQDWYDSEWYRVGKWPTNAANERENPTGPQAGSHRVLRGGSWSYFPWNLRSAGRFRDSPTNRDYYNGFRFCLDSE